MVVVVIKHEDKEAQAPSCSVYSVDTDLPGWRSGIQLSLNLPVFASSPPLFTSGLSKKRARTTSGKTVLGCPGQRKRSRRVCLVSKL